MDAKINALVIDDEAKSRSYLRQMLLEFCPEVRVLGEADSMQSGLEAIRRHQPDLVFLDIKMPHGTGFDLLDELGRVNFEVIFTTAHDNYALKAIKFSALDYLLKPIDIDELQAAVAKVVEKRKFSTGLFEEQMRMFLANIQQRDRKFHQVALPTQEGILFLPVDQIIRCEADGSYSRIYQVDGSQLVVSKNLKEVEGLMEEFGFFRTHKSHLVNLQHISRYIKGRGGEVVMTDGSHVEVSTRKREDLLDLLMNRS